MKKLLLALAAVALVSGGALAQNTPAVTSTPTPVRTGNSLLIRYAAQVLDYRNGFIFFTTGDGYRVSPDVVITDAATASRLSRTPRTREYARASLDGQGLVVAMALSDRPLPQEATYEQVRTFAIVKSVKQTNPDFKKSRPGIEGKPVLVTFVVTVPPNTPLTDQVYLATDKSGWVANAIRMDRIDAMRYRYTAKLNSGTELDYLFTRGTWTTVERAQNGLEQAPHHIFIQNLDTENRSNQVFYWADQGASGGAPNAQATFNPSALPTPYNPSPFNFPTPRPLPTHAPRR